MTKFATIIVTIILSCSFSLFVCSHIATKIERDKGMQINELQEQNELLKHEIEILKRILDPDEIGQYVDEQIDNKLTMINRRIRNLEVKQIKIEKEKDDEPWVAPADYQEIPFYANK